MSPPLRLVISAITIGLLTQFQFGFHFSITNGASFPLRLFLNETLSNSKYVFFNSNPGNIDQIYGLYLSLQVMGGVFGGYLSHFLAEKFGRKSALLINGLILTICLVPSCLARHFGHFGYLMLSKLLVGLTSLTGMGICSVQLTEISPPQYRGMMNFGAAFMLKIGCTVAQFLSTPQMLGTNELWPYLFVVQFITALLSLILVKFTCCESPHYLVRNGQSDKARDTITYYQGNDRNTDKLMCSIEEDLCLQTESLSVWQALKHPNSKGGILLAFLLGLIFVAGGPDFVFAMSTMLLGRIGFSASVSSNVIVVLALFGIVMSVVSILVVERVGRRHLLLVNTILQALCLIAWCLQIVLFQWTHSLICGYFFVFTLFLYLAFFTIGPGTICWFLASELVPTSARAAAQCVMMTTTCSLGVIVTASFLLIQSLIGPFVYLIFAGITLALTVGLFIYLPETKNRDIVQITEEVISRHKLGLRFRKSQNEKEASKELEAMLR